VNNFNLSTLRSRSLLGLATVGAAILIAGCGSSSSGNGSTITVGNENPADALIAKGGAESTKLPTSTSTSATTPTSGPLATKPVITVPSGPAPARLETKDLIAGTGAEAKAGSKLTVNYVGVLYKNGKEFDSSWSRNEPFTFTLGSGQVIKGWEQGVPGMKVGGRRELIIPSELAYGAAGSPPKIPGNSPLIFVIDLLGT